MIKYQKDTDNIVTLRLDMTGRKANIINHEIGQAFLPVLKHLKEEKAKGALRGVILTSEKKTFLAGGDLDYLYHNTSPKEIFYYSERLKQFFRDLERPGVPVVAAINGSALGSGFELTFACHYRIALDKPKMSLGFPEVTLGLMPGSGGIIRLLWLMGIEKAYDVLTSGKHYNAKEALAEGLIHEIAKNEDEMMQKAKKWLMHHSHGIQKWDIPHEQIPFSSQVPHSIAALTARHIKKYRYNYPAPQAILNTLVEGSKVDFDTACRIESRNFTQLVTNKNSKNMTKVFWYDQNAIRHDRSRPKGYGKFRPKKVGIIGSGVMGSGIAYACATNGIEVILKDVSKSVAERGKILSEEKLNSLMMEGKISVEKKKEILSRITATEKASEFEQCDLVLEAVFENQQIKKKVAKEAGKYMDEYSFFGTNTSLLSIDELSASFPNPKNYIGLHFFAPVDKQSLVEVVKGPNTSEETIARAFDFAKKIKKTPIIVKDNPGFYAARVQNVYLLEGINMLQEGYPPAIIENVCMMAGMPIGALAKADKLSLKVVLHAEKRASIIYGKKYIIHPAVDALQIMETEGRTGRFNGAGFYNYKDNKITGFWEGLSEHFPVTQTNFDIEYLKERILFAQVLEATWCYQEGIVNSVPEANIGSVFGWGFPSFKGGVLQFVNDYGIRDFIIRAKEFEEKHGPRFIVPKLLRKMAENEEIF